MKKHYIFNKNIWTLCLIFFLSHNSSFLRAQIYVKADASGANNGSSWTNAYTDLQSALNAASSGTQILVAKGTYKPSQQWDVSTGNQTSGDTRRASFRIPDGVEVYGGFAGSETNPTNQSILDARNFSTNETILSGDFSNNDNYTVNTNPTSISITGNTENAYHVVYTRQVTNATLVDGFTITGGSADGTNDTSGGAWINTASGLDNGSPTSSSPTIRNIIFTQNFASFGGGAFSNDATLNSICEPSFTNCEFTQNQSPRGGAFYNNASRASTEIFNAGGRANPSFTNCDFHQNEGTTNGGAIYATSINNAAAVFSGTDCNFTQNSSAARGGAIYKLATTINELAITSNFIRCHFEKNQANEGGAIFNGTQTSDASQGVDQRFEECTFFDNTAASRGGVFSNSANTGTKLRIIFVNGLFVRNSTTNANGEGGVTSNISTGVNPSDGTVKSRAECFYFNCTFTKNSSAIGDVLLNWETFGGSVNQQLRNCILWDNGAGVSWYAKWSTGFLAISNSLIDEASASVITSGNYTSTNSPNFNNTLIYGTDPAFTDPDNDDYTLSNVSPAINQGNNSNVSGITIDLAGNARVQQSTVDIGAYESPYTTPVFAPEINVRQNTTDINDEGSFNFSGSTFPSNQDVVFTIQNTGNATLNITSITANGDFSIQGATPSSIDVNDSETITVRMSGSSGGSKSGTLTISNDDSDEGTYDISLSGTVAKANQTITFNSLPTKTFGDTNFNLSATGGGSGNTVTFVSSNTAVATISGNTVTIVGAGNTNITASQAGNGNYNAASDVMQQLTVNKANQNITFTSLANKTYGDANFNLSATGGGSGNTVTFMSSNTAVATISGNTVTIVGAGNTNITASQAGNGHYNAASDVMQGLTIDKAALQATAEDKARTVGAANPTFTITYSGFVNGDDASDLDTAPMASTTANTGSLVGTYDINVSGGMDNNYDFTYVKGTLTIANSVLNVVADDKSRAFGEDNPTLTFTYSGFEAGDNASMLDTEPTISTTAMKDSPVGTYDIVVSGGTDSKYAFSYTKGTLTVNKADQTITFDLGTDATKTFGDAAFDLTGSTSSGLDLTYASSNTAVATIAGNTVTLIAVGTTDITASQPGDNNYNPAADVTQTLTVEALVTSLTDINQTQIDVFPNPTQDFIQVDGLDQGETNFSVTNNLGIAILSGNTIGDFTLNLSSLPVGIYQITLISGDQVITKKIVKE